jgi:basic membrane lipoprotein Med (substrate-binding protein (PBP1-ABC) superfamily)
VRSLVSLLVLACLTAGCGGGTSKTAAVATTTAPGAARPATTADALRIGVDGDLSVQVPGAIAEHGRLAAVVGDALVVVSAADRAAAGVPAAAVAHPITHFALAGASARGRHLPNLAGLVLRHDQAARLGGVVAGLVASEEGASATRVAWVGPREPPLAAAFVRGVHDAAPGTVVLRVWSRDRPAACKEAALGAIARGAAIVMARGGRCAAAAIAGAHQQNHPGLQLSDFELPSIAAVQIVRDAVAGVYHGGEDLVYGAPSGAIAVRSLDSRISATTAARARAAAQQLASGQRPSG